MLKETNAGIIIPIKVTPKSHRNEIIGWENDQLKLRIMAVPEKGNANEAVLRFLAKFFQISVSNVTLLSGATSRHKRVCIKGLSLEEVKKSLSMYI